MNKAQPVSIFDGLSILIGGFILTAGAFYILEIESGNWQREKALRLEIAQNFDKKWNDCAAAKRLVSDYKCSR